MNTDTGEKTFFRVGWCPVVSSDGKTILVHDFDRQWSVVDVATRNFRRIEWPGAVYRGAIALLDGKHVIYWGLPTSGTPIRYTKGNSPLVGAKEMLTIKVAELESGRFQTLVPYIDPRLAVSFGLENRVR